MCVCVCVLQLVQIIINTTHLEQACKYLEDFITNITNVSPETVHTTRLYGLSTFKVPAPPVSSDRLQGLNTPGFLLCLLINTFWIESDGWIACITTGSG